MHNYKLKFEQWLFGTVLLSVRWWCDVDKNI